MLIRVRQAANAPCWGVQLLSGGQLGKKGKSGVWLEQQCHAVRLGAAVAEVAQQRGIPDVLSLMFFHVRNVTFHGDCFVVII